MNYEIGDEVWVKGKIVKQHEIEGSCKVEFLEGTMYFEKDSLNKHSVDADTRECIHELYMKVKSLQEENKKLKNDGGK